MLFGIVFLWLLYLERNLYGLVLLGILLLLRAAYLNRTLNVFRIPVIVSAMLLFLINALFGAPGGLTGEAPADGLWLRSLITGAKLLLGAALLIHIVPGVSEWPMTRSPRLKFYIHYGTRAFYLVWARFQDALSMYRQHQRLVRIGEKIRLLAKTYVHLLVELIRMANNMTVVVQAKGAIPSHVDWVSPERYQVKRLWGKISYRMIGDLALLSFVLTLAFLNRNQNLSTVWPPLPWLSGS
jgi:hypothetical protein